MIILGLSLKCAFGVGIVSYGGMVLWIHILMDSTVLYCLGGIVVRDVAVFSSLDLVVILADFRFL